VPAKILDSRFQDHFVEPMLPIFERLTRLRGLKHTPSVIAPAVHDPQGGNRSII
jgi:hypothetical protein